MLLGVWTFPDGTRLELRRGAQLDEHREDFGEWHTRVVADLPSGPSLVVEIVDVGTRPPSDYLQDLGLALAAIADAIVSPVAKIAKRMSAQEPPS